MQKINLNQSNCGCWPGWVPCHQWEMSLVVPAQAVSEGKPDLSVDAELWASALLIWVGTEYSRDFAFIKDQNITHFATKTRLFQSVFHSLRCPWFHFHTRCHELWLSNLCEETVFCLCFLNEWEGKSECYSLSELRVRWIIMTQLTIIQLLHPVVMCDKLIGKQWITGKLLSYTKAKWFLPQRIASFVPKCITVISWCLLYAQTVYLF